jgi:hypothetical protein
MLTVEGTIKKVVIKKFKVADVIKFVLATNTYRIMFPLLLKEAVSNYNSRQHNQLVELERLLFRIQNKVGKKLGILAKEPPPEKFWKEKKYAFNR